MRANHTISIDSRATPHLKHQTLPILSTPTSSSQDDLSRTRSNLGLAPSPHHQLDQDRPGYPYSLGFHPRDRPIGDLDGQAESRGQLDHRCRKSAIDSNILLQHGREQLTVSPFLLLQSVKSLVILSYEVLTERVQKLRRWGSLKAYSILNCIEFVFWVAATAITGMGLTRRCAGTSCGLGVVIMLVTITLM